MATRNLNDLIAMITAMDINQIPEETVHQRVASYFEKVSLNAQIRNITLLHSSSTSNNNYPQYKAPPPDYAPIHGLSSLLS